MFAPSAIALELERSSVVRADQIAIRTVRHAIDYEELGSAVAGLSATILDRGWKQQWLPVVVDRSIESAIAVLSAIHSGQPFVPIDSSFPAERIAKQLSMAGSPGSALVPRKELASLLPPNMETLAPGEHNDTVAPAQVVDHEAPGCLLFTSGSTGSPKGVVRRWAGFDRELGEIRSREYSAAHRTSVLSPFGFLGAVSALSRVTTGNPICLADPREQSLDALIDWLASQSVTHARLGGSIVDSLLRREVLTCRLPTAIEFTVFGSRRDWSQIPLIRRLCSPDVVVINQYASTESGNLCRFVIGRDDELHTGRLPTGTLPIDRLKLVACDEGREIWVRDPDALEYLNDPELTAKRFVTDDDGVRWWRSGDLGRVDVDENFHFTGRIDLMVKINGMRVEPEESEHALRSIPGIGSAAVVAHPTKHGSLRLVGHVCVDDSSLTPDSVKAQLSTILPSHLVPAVLMRHETLPYTDRQKVDRKALLSIPLQRWTTRSTRGNYSQETLWLTSKIEEIIGLGEVHPGDDIWEAGLDSIGAVELCSRISAEGLGRLDPRELLSARTTEGLAHHLGLRRPANPSQVVEFNAEGRHLPIFAVPGTTGTAFAYRSLAETLGRDQPLVVIEPRGMHCKGRIERTIEERAASIVDVVKGRLEPGRPCLLISHSGGATIAFEAARSLIDSGRSTHVIFLDGIPRDSTTQPRTSPVVRKFVAERRRISSSRSFLKWLFSVLRRAPRKVWAMSTMPIRAKFPGRRRFSTDHYKIFWWIEQRALKKYRLRPLEVSATLLHIGKTSLPEKCSQWVDVLDSHVVGGNHSSMLYPPHVQEIADHVIRIREQLTSRTRSRSPEEMSAVTD